jgi:hypothetical protein
LLEPVVARDQQLLDLCARGVRAHEEAGYRWSAGSSPGGHIVLTDPAL